MIKKILTNIVTYFLIIVLTLYLGLIIYNKFINKGKAFAIGNYYIFQVASGSMQPSLSVNDYIIVKKTKDLKVGDIITFEDENSYTTHRIKSINNNIITTKGDANNIEDSPIKRNKVLGKYLCKASFINFLFKYKLIILSLMFLFIIIKSIW